MRISACEWCALFPFEYFNKKKVFFKISLEFVMQLLYIGKIFFVYLNRMIFKIEQRKKTV